MLRRTCSFALVALLASLVGCSGSSEPTAYPTTGTVQFEGKPMKGGGAISFVPVSSQPGKAAGGEIREDGSFVMTTYAEGDGSIPGTFRVIVLQSTSKESEIIANDGEGKPTKANGPIETVAQGDRIPFIYADPAKSPVTVEIKAQDKNDLTIELKRS